MLARRELGRSEARERGTCGAARKVVGHLVRVWVRVRVRVRRARVTARMGGVG